MVRAGLRSSGGRAGPPPMGDPRGGPATPPGWGYRRWRVGFFQPPDIISPNSLVNLVLKLTDTGLFKVFMTISEIFQGKDILHLSLAQKLICYSITMRCQVIGDGFENGNHVQI